MKYHAIIFDFDGVLFDSEKTHLRACNQVFQSLGFTVEEDDYFKNYVGLSDNEMFELILNKQNIVYTQEECLQLRINKIMAYQNIIHQCDSLDAVHHVKRFLEDHSHSIKNYAICSGANRQEIDSTLHKLESGQITKYFKHIISIDDISAGKPSPEGYLLAAKRLDISPENCLVIEDTPVGIRAGKSAGMDVAALTTTHHESALTSADFIAHNYDEISHWLKT